MRRAPEVRNKHREKKLRGWRNKQYHLDKISRITEDGFWICNEGQDFYISRKKYPWFLDATEKEIRDMWKVSYIERKKPPQNSTLWWEQLDFGIPMRWVRNPKTLPAFTGVYVRGQDRPDLHARSVYGGYHENDETKTKV